MHEYDKTLADLAYECPASQIKTIDVPPIPRRIFDDLKAYEDNARGCHAIAWEHSVETAAGAWTKPTVIVKHRPADAQVDQLYRLPEVPTDTSIERLTHFDIGTGRVIAAFLSVPGDDWRGIRRRGGAILCMDVDGSENHQLWRYWEDPLNDAPLPHNDGELDNSPGIGRIERLTHDNFKNLAQMVSPSYKYFLWTSNKGNNRDMLVYITRLVGSDTGIKPDDGARFDIPSFLVTPAPVDSAETWRWHVQSISLDEKFMLLTRVMSNVQRPLYLIDLSPLASASAGVIPTFKPPKRIIFPGAPDDCIINYVRFSKDPARPSLIYFLTDAYGDFVSVVSYDLDTEMLIHITTPEPSVQSLRPIPWNTSALHVTRDIVYFTANVEGWRLLYAMPLVGKHTHTVLEVRLEGFEGGGIGCLPDTKNEGRYYQLALTLQSHESQYYVVRVDVAPYLEMDADAFLRDADKRPHITMKGIAYRQATPSRPTYKTFAPSLLRFKSFDGLEISCMYYRPHNADGPLPVIINIHGGPESQATASYRGLAIHDYVLNVMGCAIIYPNVRGSSGYGRTYLKADDVEKREDSVKDIGALLDFIRDHKSDELDATKIAVMGGSYGGYMTFACLVHYSPRFKCGFASFGISHWPSFLHNTAPSRRDMRRAEYGDERIPEIREFLEHISPVNNAHKITIPLGIAHGDKDSRVPLGEALLMRDRVRKQGGPVELIICEKEGHGFKQKTVIEYTNAAKVYFLERMLLSRNTV
ncbi:alpha/beta-hydrolase [Fistulina hepatica ATCC 64428]|uniref:Dipeptidyl-peptidase V n=1 Tax=Fistulina hepatica ATCC 64428 TaxID=1128425 RepID=A0A0D7AIY8_9AGAR|nr:alpha/beta-hydrolase [Fistulina hepatica ATCC 64428]